MGKEKKRKRRRRKPVTETSDWKKNEPPRKHIRTLIHRRKKRRYSRGADYKEWEKTELGKRDISVSRVSKSGGKTEEGQKGDPKEVFHCRYETTDE